MYDDKVLVRKQEMKLIEALRGEPRTIEEIQERSGYKVDSAKGFLREMMQMDWVFFDKKTKLYTLNEENEYESIRLHNGKVM